MDSNKKSDFLRIISNKWSLIGIVLILLSIVLSQVIEALIDFPALLQYCVSILANLLSTVGIALLIGAIFDLSKSSQAFVDYISQILADVVVSNDFIKKLSIDDKVKLSNLILKSEYNGPSENSSLNDYFMMTVDNLMRMGKQNFKDHAVYDLVACIEGDSVIVKGTLQYRTHSVDGKYASLHSKFSNKKSTIKTKIFVGNKAENVDYRRGEDSETYIFDIPNEYLKYPHLDIEHELYEVGHQGFINYYIKTLSPCNVIYVTMKCNDGLEIKEYFIFDDKSKYDVSFNASEIKINNRTWGSQNSGVVISIHKLK